MDNSVQITEHGGRPKPRRVIVPGRDDVGVVVIPGKNFGMNPNVYVLGIHFPETGEFLYYDVKRVKDAPPE